MISRRRVGPITLSTMLICAMCAISAQTGSDIESQGIRYFEELPALEIEQSGFRSSPTKLPLSVGFRAFGEDFQLELEEIDLFSEDASVHWVLPSGEYVAQPQSRFFKGRLAGRPDSWARLSLLDGSLQGMIRSSEEIYFLSPASRLSQDSAPSASAIYRLSDTESLWKEHRCALHPDDLEEPEGQTAKSGASMADYQKLLDHLEFNAAGGLKEAELHVIADGLYFDRHGANSNARMAEAINNTAGIYENEVGVTFRIGKSTIYTPATDPFTSALGASNLLENLTFDQPHIDGYDLAHLFTGRNLSGSTIGIAFISVVCNSLFGTGLSQDLSSSASRTILAAHELGHNFAARHDGTGSCSSEPFGFVMWPSLNSSATQFSQCSKNAINQHLASISCLADLPGTPPPAPTLVSPTGTIEDPRPTYVWNAASEAEEYKLWLWHNGVYFVRDVFTAAEAGCASGTGTCSITPSVDLADGPWRWWVMSRNSAGDSSLTRGDFNFLGPQPPPAPTPLSPSGSVVAGTHSYSWQSVESADSYKVLVWNNGVFLERRDYSLQEVGCASGQATCTVSPPSGLAPGEARWWVMARNQAGDSPLSRTDLSVGGLDPPGTPTPIAPTGSTADNTPSYSWQSVAGATHYKLWVWNNGAFLVRQLFTAAQTGCGSGQPTCSVTPSDALAPGEARWWILASNAAGSSALVRSNFSVGGLDPPAAPTPLSPNSAISDATPAYSWQAVAGADSYKIWVFNGGGFIVRQEFTASQAGCASGTGTCSVNPSASLTSGAATWWVLARNAAGNSPLSRTDFSLQ